MQISIIIVNYNSGEFLGRCLDSLVRSSGSCEIIVIDNCSQDESIALAGKKISAHERVKFVINEQNLGFAAACNIGVRVATGENLLFLNPDCQVQADALAVMARFLADNPAVGMVGGLVRNNDGSFQPTCCRKIPTPFSVCREIIGKNDKARWPLDSPVEVEAISGACMMVRRGAMEEVGLLDDNYFLHCEDLDWCLRFKQKGWRIFMVPEARIIHEKGVCSRKTPLLVEWHKHQGMVLFNRKHHKKMYSRYVYPLMIAGIWLHFIVITPAKIIRNLFHNQSR